MVQALLGHASIQLAGDAKKNFTLARSVIAHFRPLFSWPGQYGNAAVIHEIILISP